MRSVCHAFLLLAMIGWSAVGCGTCEGRYDGDEIEEGDDVFGGDDDVPPLPTDDDDDDIGDDDGGEPLPNWSWENDDGDTVELYDFKGKVLVLGTGAGWCIPCREEAPQLEADLYQEYKDEGFEIIELLVEDNENDPPSTDFLRQWRAEYGLTYTVCADPGWTLLPYFTEGSLPFNMIVDRNLVPQFTSHGYDKAVFQGLIEDLL